MVLELLKYANSAMKNLDQSEATFGSHMTTMEASDWSKNFIAGFKFLNRWRHLLIKFTFTFCKSFLIGSFTFVKMNKMKKVCG